MTTAWRHIAAAMIMTLAALLPAAGQRRLFASEGDGPERSWVIDGMTGEKARDAIGESRAGRAEGIWQATADGAIVALMEGDAPGLWRDTASGDGYTGVRRLLIVIVDSPRPGVLPGTVMGWATPAATPDKWDARIFTRTDGRELHTPRRFTLTLADDNHITFTPASSGIKISLWRMMPYIFRAGVRETAPPDGLDGLLRLWPPSADTPPVTPVYL